MTIPIALQLYTVREALAQDFAGVIRQIAGMGYAGVETAGFPGCTPAATAHLFRELGLAVTSAHAPLPLGDQKNEVLDTMAALACTRLICAYIPPDQYQTLDQVRRVCERLNEANAVARENGLSLGLHNHWWEFQEVEGRPAYKVLLEQLDPTIFFELDTYWIKTAGLDPVAVIQELGARVPLLHIKDGPAVTDAPMVAVGDGVMDVPAIVRAGEGHTEWLIVELDRCATDMMAAVARSFNYLVEGGLGRGQS